MLLDANGNQMDKPAMSGFKVDGSISSPKTGGSPGLSKQAINMAGGANVTQVPSQWYSPELTNESYLLPKSRPEVLKWSLGDTEIATPDGFAMMSSLKDGDVVLSETGFPIPITGKLERDYAGKMVDVLAHHFLKPVPMTDYHPVLAVRMHKKTDKAKARFLEYGFAHKELKIKDHCNWVSAALLEEGDLLVIPKFKQVSPGPVVIDLKPYVVRGTSDEDRIYVQKDVSLRRKVVVDSDLAYAFGWFVAEGNVSNSSICFTMNKDERPDAERLMKIILSSFDLPRGCARIIPHNRHIRLMVGSAVVARCFEDLFNTGSRIKKIPEALMYADRALVYSFLVGYVSGDGSLNVKNRTFYSATASKQLAYQLFQLFTKIDILPSFRERIPDINKISFSGVKPKTIAPHHYYLTVSGGQVSKLFPEIPCQVQQEKWYSDENAFYVGVWRLKTYDYSGKVYDYTTVDHSINVPFVTHNCRVFYNLEAYLFAIINMHAMYPFSKFDIVTPDKSVTQFYKEVAFSEHLDLYQHVLQASLSYWKFGEAISFLTMKQDDKEVAGESGDLTANKRLWRWQKAVLLEPEIVEIEQEFFEEEPIFWLIPTDGMKKLANATDSDSQKRKSNVDPGILQMMQTGKRIPLDKESVSMIARITDPSATRGTPVLQALFKPLIFQDQIRLAQSALATRYHFPVEMWTLGNVEHDLLPTEQDLNSMRELINQAIQQPPFSIVVPPTLKYEALGVAGKWLPVKDDYDYIQDQIFVGLGVSRDLMTGQGPSFSSMKAMSLQKLIMVYKSIRDLFENWMINKFFRPLAIRNGFYMTVGGRKQLILPQISWYKSLDVEAAESERKEFKELHGKGFISTETLFAKYPQLDFATERRRLEAERGTVWDKGDKRIPKEFSTKDVNKVSTESPGGEGGAPPMPELPGGEGGATNEVPEAGPAPEGAAPAAEAPGAPETPAEAPAPETPAP